MPTARSQIDGAELDPEIIAVGRRLVRHERAEPAQRWPPTGGVSCLLPLHSTTTHCHRDAYRPPYIPFHLTTVEFFALARDRLADDGVVAVNVGRTHTDYSLVDAIAADHAAGFPQRLHRG